MKIIDKNYTCQVIELPETRAVKGLDNLVEVNVFGNSCLIGKDSPKGLYLFFPAECKIHPQFLIHNNLYRHSNLNADPDKKGFFEDTGRVKAVKFKGIISTGFVTPIDSLYQITGDLGLKAGDEFNEIAGIKLCVKYKIYRQQGSGNKNTRQSVIDSIVDAKLAPEHFDTEHLMKNLDRINPTDSAVISVKLHGTSARVYRTLIKRKLSLVERIAKFFGANVLEEDYDYVVGSRRVIKSVGFDSLRGKNHYYQSGDLWTEVCRNTFANKLHKGEAVYFEIVGKTYEGEEIQKGYSYGLNSPDVYVYRISRINPDGIEVDLTQKQMEQRAAELGVKTCPVIYNDRFSLFIFQNTKESDTDRDFTFHVESAFYDNILEQPSQLDPTVVEEGYCVRFESYPKPKIYKIKSKKFLAHESVVLDTGETNLEDDDSASNN